MGIANEFRHTSQSTGGQAMRVTKSMDKCSILECGRSIMMLQVRARAAAQRMM